MYKNQFNLHSNGCVNVELYILLLYTYKNQFNFICIMLVQILQVSQKKKAEERTSPRSAWHHATYQQDSKRNTDLFQPPRCRPHATLRGKEVTVTGKTYICCLRDWDLSA